MSADSPRFLFVLDDGWLHEKQVLLRTLREELAVDVASHVPATVDRLAEFDPIALPSYPLPKGAAYTWRMFWARELGTHMARRPRERKILAAPFPVRTLWRLRTALAPLRRRSYPEQLARLYRGSHRYTSLLDRYDFLVFNPVTVVDKRILFECLEHPHCQLVSWVYSWDNPFKDNEFIHQAAAYLVWSEQGAQDLRDVHDIDPARVYPAGPVQFDYLLSLRAAPVPAATPPYLLYMCSLASEVYIDQEVDLILRIRNTLDELAPGLGLKVRPYPFRHRNLLFMYDRLRQRQGIEVLEYGELMGPTCVPRAEDFTDKYRQMAAARGIINLGSTIGLEAAYTDTPVLQIAFVPGRPGTPAAIDVADLFLNEHLRHLLDHDLPNILHDEGDLRRALRDLAAGTVEPYMEYTRRLRDFVGADSSEPCALRFRRALKTLARDLARPPRSGPGATDVAR